MTSLLDVIAGRYNVALVSAGHELCLACPLCDDHKPRLFINAYTGRWMCHNCDEAGGLTTFLERVMGLDPFEAYRVAQKINPQALTRSREPEQALPAEDVELPGLLLGNPADEFEQPFWRYLTRTRKLTPTQVTSYGMRYALTGRFGYRVIIPVVLSGVVVSFVARTIRGDEPKVLHPQGIHMGDLLFGLDDLETKEVIITEGVFDAMRLRGRAVCTFGAKLSPAQRRLLLRRGVRQVLLLWDGDEAGQRATKKAARELISSGFDVRIAQLPEGDDPASASQRNLTEALAEARSNPVLYSERSILTQGQIN